MWHVAEQESVKVQGMISVVLLAFDQARSLTAFGNVSEQG